MNSKKAVSLSFIMHSLSFILISSILFKGCGSGSSKANGRNKNINIIESSKEVDVDVLTKEEMKRLGIPIPKKKIAERKCPKDWYGGIGIINVFDSHGTAIITSVPKGYPADRAGFERGDILVDGCPKCIGEVGEEVVVLVKKIDGT